MYSTLSQFSRYACKILRHRSNMLPWSVRCASLAAPWLPDAFNIDVWRILQQSGDRIGQIWYEIKRQTYHMFATMLRRICNILFSCLQERIYRMSLSSKRELQLHRLIPKSINMRMAFASTSRGQFRLNFYRIFVHVGRHLRNPSPYFPCTRATVASSLSGSWAAQSDVPRWGPSFSRSWARDHTCSFEAFTAGRRNFLKTKMQAAESDAEGMWVLSVEPFLRTQIYSFCDLEALSEELPVQIRACFLLLLRPRAVVLLQAEPHNLSETFARKAWSEFSEPGFKIWRLWFEEKSINANHKERMLFKRGKLSAKLASASACTRCYLAWLVPDMSNSDHRKPI